MSPQQKLAPLPPGEFLLEEFMQPLGLSQNKLGRGVTWGFAPAD